jgi:ferric-dicitrate binding protein FerR (iron transport regulator)
VNREQLIAAWLRHLDGGPLTPEERAALVAAWAADPALRAVCEADAAIDASLRSRPGDADADAAFTAGVATLLRTQRDGGAFAARVARRIRSGGRRRSRGWLIQLAPWGLAAALLAATLAVFWPAAPDLPRLDGTIVAAGARLAPAQDAVLTWRDGTSAAIAAGSVIGILPAEAGKALRLEAGRLSVTAAAQPTGRPLTIRSPEALATVVGTRFVLDTAAGTTRLAVDHGTVRLQGAAATLEVAAGSRAIADQAGIRAAAPLRWGWSAGDPLPATLQRGTLGRAPDGRACLLAQRHNASTAAVVWAATPDGLFAGDPDSELVGDVWLDAGTAWAGIYAQSDGERGREAGRPAVSHHGQADLPLAARTGWYRFRVRLADLAAAGSGPPLRPGEPITHLIIQAQPVGSAIRLDRLELRTP